MLVNLNFVLADFYNLLFSFLLSSSPFLSSLVNLFNFFLLFFFLLSSFRCLYSSGTLLSVSTAAINLRWDVKGKCTYQRPSGGWGGCGNPEHFPHLRTLYF